VQIARQGNTRLEGDSMVRVGLCRLQKTRGLVVEKWPSWEERGRERQIDLDDGPHVISSSAGAWCLVVLATEHGI
jgi:hypothetical protein